MAVTLRDVAQQAGVSVTTASRALNQRGYVSKATSEAVKNACLELHYKAGHFEKKLLTAYDVIALIVPSVIHPFFCQLFQELNDAFMQEGYAMLLCNTYERPEQNSKVLALLKQQHVAGVIVASHTFPTEELAELEVPLIGFDTIFENSMTTISVNHKKGGEMAAEYLIKRGANHALQVCGDPSTNSDCRKRHQSFMNAMIDAGKSCVSVPIFNFREITSADFFDSVSDVLDMYSNVDAVFATDRVAIEIQKYYERKGVRIPEDVQIISYDGTNLVNLISHPLTAIGQPFDLLAKATVDAMMKLLAGETVPPKIVVDELRVIVGSTTRP